MGLGFREREAAVETLVRLPSVREVAVGIQMPAVGSWSGSSAAVFVDLPLQE